MKVACPMCKDEVMDIGPPGGPRPLRDQVCEECKAEIEMRRREDLLEELDRRDQEAQLFGDGLAES